MQPAAPDIAGLRALVAETLASGAARRALLLHADLLPAALRRPHHHRLLREALGPLRGADRARLFEAAAGRIVAVWRGEAEEALAEVTATLGHLVAGSPGAPEPTALVSLFDLPGGAMALLRAAERPGPAPDAAPQERRPLDPLALARLERDLAQADLASFARRQPVCRLGEAGPELAWEKRMLSVAALGAALAPGVDLAADPWLFRRLSRVLDRRLLALLAAPGELQGAGPFGLDLNVATLLSPEFLRFDNALPGRLRGRVVLGLAPADIVSDPAAFVFARGFARGRGYRLLLQGVTARLLPALCPARFELDHIQLRHDPSLQADGAMPGEIDRAGLVLEADTEAAMAWGGEQGIGFFAGGCTEGAALAKPAPGPNARAWTRSGSNG